MIICVKAIILPRQFQIVVPSNGYLTTHTPFPLHIIFYIPIILPLYDSVEVLYTRALDSEAPRAIVCMMIPMNPFGLQDLKDLQHTPGLFIY